MLKIEVASFAGQPPGQPLAAQFDETGGTVFTIGRGDASTLVLPDTKRYISRTQATLTFRAGDYVLLDGGSATPTIVNGAPVGNGNEVALRDGDEIRIDEYAMRVAITAAPAAAGAQLPAFDANDPFADLLPSAASAQPPAAAQDPFADLIPPASSPQPRASARAVQPSDDPLGPRAPGAAPAPGVIPADFDPFADLMPQSQAPGASPQLPDDLNLTPSSAQSVDDLFGLKTSSNWDPLGPQDPLAEGASGADPLAPYGASPGIPAAPAQRDDASILSSAFQPPSARPEPPEASPAPPAEPPAAPRAAAGDMVFSWDTQHSPQGTNEIKTMILASPKREAAPAPAAPPASAAPAPAASAPLVAAAPARVEPRPAAAPDAAPSAPPDELLRAFLAGLGTPELRLPSGLTPELMHAIGELVHEAMRGTLELLLARALTKREVRAEATVIVARENNPLKFSPTVEAALAHLLVPQSTGFMKPTDAVRDAYNDLRSHQFGIMAGMRAALEGVLARFDPAQLESRLTTRGVLGSLMPSTRRAKLWELYEQLYRDISTEAQDDFQALFGKAFLRAYEAQIDKLEQEDAAAKR